MMVGREVLFQLDKADKPTGQEVLSLQGIWSLSDKRLPALRGLSLSVRAGEILGIAGVAGNGQRELAETITGLRPVTKGRILVNQKDTTNKKPLQMIERGVAHVPEDRKGTGTIPNLAVLDNLMLKLSLIHISEPTRLGMISYAVFCLK